VSLEDCPPRSVTLLYHLLETTPCPGEGVSDTTDATEDAHPARTFMKAGKLVPLDMTSFTNGPYTPIYSAYLLLFKYIVL